MTFIKIFLYLKSEKEYAYHSNVVLELNLDFYAILINCICHRFQNIGFAQMQNVTNFKFKH